MYLIYTCTCIVYSVCRCPLTSGRPGKGSRVQMYSPKSFLGALKVINLSLELPLLTA